MLMPVLSIGMVVEATHDHGSARRTAGGGGKGIKKNRTVLGQCIDGRRLGNRVTIATERGRFIIRNEENDILFSRR